MSDQIGNTAGEVWGFLRTQGKASASQIQKAVGTDAALTNQALGWLAREGKLRVDRTKKTAQYELAD